MMSTLFIQTRVLLLSLLAAAGLAGCGGAPSTTGNETAEPAARAGKTHYRVALDPEFALDYDVEVKYSSVDGRSCYAFITGTLENNSNRVLSRRSVLDFIVVYKGEMLFRDLTNPRSDIPPGGRAMITMIDSPVHQKHCPVYERIDISLRKVFAS